MEPPQIDVNLTRKRTNRQWLDTATHNVADALALEAVMLIKFFKATPVEVLLSFTIVCFRFRMEHQYSAQSRVVLATISALSIQMAAEYLGLVESFELPINRITEFLGVSYAVAGVLLARWLLAINAVSEDSARDSRALRQ